jgi:hypothetical protein
MIRLIYFFILLSISIRTFSQYCETDTSINIEFPFHYINTTGGFWIVYEDSLFRHKTNDSVLIPDSKDLIGSDDNYYSETLEIPIKDSIVFYYPMTVFPYYVLINQGNYTKITFHDLINKDQSSLLLKNGNYVFKMYHSLTWKSPPYLSYNCLVINKTNNQYISDRRCFSTEAKDTCIVVMVNNVHKLRSIPDKGYTYYYATIELFNKCDKDIINHCLNVAEFFQLGCSAWDFFITNRNDIYTTCSKDCSSNIGFMQTLKTRERIIYDSILFHVGDAECLTNNKCKAGFIFVTYTDRNNYGGFFQSMRAKTKNIKGIIWSDEFSFE